jgi:hypothetical protein
MSPKACYIFQSTSLLCVVAGGGAIKFVIYCYLLSCIAYLIHTILLYLVSSDKYVPAWYVTVIFYIFFLVINSNKNNVQIEELNIF